MPARKRKTTKRRKAARRKSSRPIVLQLPPPAKKRRRRRNPVATVVNPSRRRKVVRRRRRRKRNPSLVKGIKGTFKGKVLLPILIGGGLGVVGISASQRWLAPRLSPKWQALAEAAIGIAGLPVVNKLYKGSGPYFTGFMVGSALTTVIKPLLPWGEYDDDIDALIEGDGVGDIELIGGMDDGDLGFGEAEADSAAAGDDGLEEIIDDGPESHLVDGLGALPPVRMGNIPPRLIHRLRQAGLLWLLRLGLPHENLMKLLSMPLPVRRGILMRLRKRYMGMRRKAVKRHGKRWKAHPYVVHHPVRKRQAARGRGRGRPGPRQAMRRHRRRSHMNGMGDGDPQFDIAGFDDSDPMDDMIS